MTYHRLVHMEHTFTWNGHRLVHMEHAFTWNGHRLSNGFSLKKIACLLGATFIKPLQVNRDYVVFSFSVKRNVVHAHPAHVHSNHFKI